MSSESVECHIPYQEGTLPVDALPVWWTFQSAAGSPHVPDYFDLTMPLAGKNRHEEEQEAPAAPADRSE